MKIPKLQEIPAILKISRIQVTSTNFTKKKLKIKKTAPLNFTVLQKPPKQQQKIL